MKQKELFSLYEKELRIRNYAAITISSYMHLLKLFLNYLSTHNIKKVSGKIIINYPDDCRTKKHFSYSSLKQLLALIRLLCKGVLKKNWECSYEEIFQDIDTDEDYARL